MAKIESFGLLTILGDSPPFEQFNQQRCVACASNQTDSYVLIDDGDKTLYVSPRGSLNWQTVLKSVSQIFCGAQHCLFLSEHGQLYVQGSNQHGQLGLGDNTDRAQPTLLDSLVKQGIVIRTLCDGGGSGGDVIDTENSNTESRAPVQFSGVIHSAALSDNDTWGCNADGQLGHVSEIGNQLTPMLVNKWDRQYVRPSTIKQVSLGDQFTLICTVDGLVYSCGCGINGALGHGDLVSRDEFCLVKALLSCNVRRIAAAGTCAMAVTSMDYDLASSLKHAIISWNKGGRLCTWGSGILLGIGSASRCETLPYWNKKLRLMKVRSISVCATHAVAVTSDDSVLVWGSNEHNTLGLRSTADREQLVPVEMAVPGSLNVCSRQMDVLYSGHHVTVFATPLFTMSLEPKPSISLDGTVDGVVHQGGKHCEHIDELDSMSQDQIIDPDIVEPLAEISISSKFKDLVPLIIALVVCLYFMRHFLFNSQIFHFKR